jgi:hypothetical protein
MMKLTCLLLALFSNTSCSAGGLAQAVYYQAESERNKSEIIFEHGAINIYNCTVNILELPPSSILDEE